MNLGCIATGVILTIAFPHLWYIGVPLALFGFKAKPDTRADW